MHSRRSIGHTQATEISKISSPSEAPSSVTNPQGLAVAERRRVRRVRRVVCWFLAVMDQWLGVRKQGVETSDEPDGVDAGDGVAAAIAKLLILWEKCELAMHRRVKKVGIHKSMSCPKESWLC